MKYLLSVILVAGCLIVPVLADDYAAWEGIDVVSDSVTYSETYSEDPAAPEDVPALFATRTVSTAYPQATQSGLNYLTAVLENYPATAGYLYARTGQNEYTLWVDGSYNRNGYSVDVDGGSRYVYTYHRFSGSSSDNYVTVDVASDVSDKLAFSANSTANVYGSLLGFAALREGGNTVAISWFMLAFISLNVALLPLYFFLGRRGSRRI